MKNIFALCAILSLLYTTGWAQSKRKSDPAADSNLIRKNRLIELLAGTRITQLACTELDARVCRSFFNYLVESGFKSSLVDQNEDLNRGKILSLCEVVNVRPDYFVRDGKLTDIRIHFQFCNGKKLTFTTPRAVTISWFGDDLEVGLRRAFRDCITLNKPPFDPSQMLKIAEQPSGWAEDSLIKYLKKRNRSPLEGVYDEIVSGISADESRLKIALVKKGAKYDILYLSGASNVNDWKSCEIKGSLTPTGSRDIYRVEWYSPEKERNPNLIGNIEGGMLRISLPSEVQMNRATGTVTSTVQGMFLKVLLDSVSTSDPKMGTGFAVTSTGKVVTNYHVIADAEAVYVRGLNGDFNTRVKATVLYTDKNNDMAVLQVGAGMFKVEPLPFEIRSTPVEVGTKVFILGYPAIDVMGSELKVTDGIVSSRTGYEGDVSSYQVSVPIQPGNSGSPMFDESGNVVGIANAGLRFLFDNVSYAIKSTYLSNFLTESEIKVLPAKTPNALKALPMTEKVKVLRKYVYIIEVER